VASMRCSTQRRTERSLTEREVTGEAESILG